MTTDVASRGERIAALGFDVESAETVSIKACNLCGSERRVEVSRSDRYGYPVAFHVCARCGLGFLSPRLSAAAYADFYASVYRPLVSAYHGRLIDAETVQVEQRGYAVELAAFLDSFLVAAPQTILDIGGSTGVVAQELRERLGSEVTVLDPSPDELAVASERGMRTIRGLAEDFDPADERWDLVLLCQTVDHLLDIKSTLTAMQRMVAPAGHAFVDVLDVGFMLERRREIEGAVKVDHPFYLTRETAIAFFDLAGFAVVGERLSRDGHWGFVLQRGDVGDPDWARLAVARDRLLGRVWRLRATGGG